MNFPKVTATNVNERIGAKLRDKRAVAARRAAAEEAAARRAAAEEAAQQRE